MIEKTVIDILLTVSGICVVIVCILWPLNEIKFLKFVFKDKERTFTEKMLIALAMTIVFTLLLCAVILIVYHLFIIKEI